MLIYDLGPGMLIRTLSAWSRHARGHARGHARIAWSNSVKRMLYDRAGTYCHKNLFWPENLSHKFKQSMRNLKKLYGITFCCTLCTANTIVARRRNHQIIENLTFEVLYVWLSSLTQKLDFSELFPHLCNIARTLVRVFHCQRAASQDHPPCSVDNKSSVSSR